MSKKKQLIIPIFIPFGGCAHRCVFCNQTRIAGDGETESPPTPVEVSGIIESHLATWKGSGRREVAFYGGSFTGLSEEVQTSYLAAAHEFVKNHSIDALRVSTRPDYITDGALELLSKYSVETIELGVQSMSEKVLALSERGHGPDAVVSAASACRRAGFQLGVQIMPGLPGDTRESVIQTAHRVVELGPAVARIYPTLVIKDTPLHDMYMRGEYMPWELTEMVSVCREVSDIFQAAGIRVIRMGLQPTEGLRASVVAGPFHPSFRQLVEAKG